MGCIVLGVMACSTGPPPEGVVTGIVTAIDGDLTSVDEFTILTDDGEVVFATAPEIEFRFPVPHLRDHLRSGEQVLSLIHI